MKKLIRPLFVHLLRVVGTQRALAIAAAVRGRELADDLARACDSRVQDGPFAGMRLPDRFAWTDGGLGPKLLGLYEAELHDAIRKAVGRAPSTVINVGCAEGYYAVGLARILPNATIFAFDTDPVAGEVCRDAAVVNGVGDRVIFRGACTAATLDECAARDGRTLIVMDCEGAESGLLDPGLAPRLRRCDIVVETHDFFDRSITDTLRARFAASHDLELLRQGSRDPHGVPQLRTWTELEQWVLVSEGRPETQRWLLCWAH